MRPLLLNEPLVANRRDADALMFNRTPLSDRNAFFSRLVPESGRSGCEISFGVIAVDASRVTTPVLVVSGRDDHFVALRVARAIARKYRARLLTYDSFGHHIMSEPGWEGPATDVVNWMDETMSRESVVHRKAERAAHSIK